MKKYYKLTDRKMQTYGGFQWTLGGWQEAKGNLTKELCSDAWLHCYDSPLLAILHNPIHANITNPRLFEVEVGGETKDDGEIKRGFHRMRLVKEISLPEITKNQKQAYGILCAKEVYKGKSWNEWADNWLNGKYRSKRAARAAAHAAHAAYAAAHAAHAADAAAHAAHAADAAAAAAYAADAAKLDLVKIAEKAVKEF